MLSVAVAFVTRQRFANAVRCGLAAGLLAFGFPLLAPTTGHAKADATCGSTDAKQPAELVRQGITTPIDDSKPGEKQPSLEVNGYCKVKPADPTESNNPSLNDYYFGKVNITNGGVLIFEEGPSTARDKVVNFWAKSIIVENGGTMMAGVDDTTDTNITPGTKPYGTNGFTLNIILYDNESGKGDNSCISEGAADCGIPSKMWSDNGATDNIPGCGGDEAKPNSMCIPGLLKTATDNFYQYGTQHNENAHAKAYYGYKVLGVGYGGALRLYGKKGTTRGADIDAGRVAPEPSLDPKNPVATRKITDTGTSWTRLAGAAKREANLTPGGKALVVSHAVEGDWQPGDRIVVTTTDYLPNHSEELVIDTVSGDTVNVKDGVKWEHVGQRYKLADLLKGAGKGFNDAGMDPDLKQSAETRAAVALLTRNIRIISGGDFAGDYFDCVKDATSNTWYVPRELTHNNNDKQIVQRRTEDNVLKCATARNQQYYFGGQTMFRQGFRKLQLQGVEFHQLGQGGRIGHYPVHFHNARRVPSDTYVKDSSVSESMTRWFVLHSTQGVLLQRNVGWKSIGHGYYFEDGTEADNKLYANIGIFARGAVQGPDNPRNVPGILASNIRERDVQTRSDVVHPTAFWITNGWNEFAGNMAAGAGTCGSCFWLVPLANSDMVEVQPMQSPMKHMKWTGYAGQQARFTDPTPPPNDKGWTKAGQTPVKLFYKNYCSTAMHSLNTADAASVCNAVFTADEPGPDRIHQVKSFAPAPAPANQPWKETYYPGIAGNRAPTVCSPDKKNNEAGACTGPYDEKMGVNDNTRPNVVSRCDNADPKTCGMTVIDHYTTSFNWAATNFSAVWLRTPGWFLLDNSFISDVQLAGVTLVSGGDYSRSSAALGYWALVGRSVFVGETQKDNNFAKAAGPKKEATGDIIGCDPASTEACIDKANAIAFPLVNWGVGQRLFNIYDGPAHQDGNAFLNITKSECKDVKSCMYFGMAGVRRDVLDTGAGFLPNAAIGWKQPNGFYYPPAFHSKNLFFNNVDIRHYVIQPLFSPGTYLTDEKRLNSEFAGVRAGQTGLFTGFTDVDRQTELNDDDGTLTGFRDTISVNEDAFYSGPIQAPQCKSNIGVDPKYACAGKQSPKAPPPTARTSPYDYVTTVIYPGCAIKKSGNMPPGWPGACGSAIDDKPYDDPAQGGRWLRKAMRGGTWSRDCASAYCFGVPIYRQFLTSDTTAANPREWQTWSSKCKKPTDDTTGKVKKDCNFPFARMSGASIWQRDVMTVNNGKFFIDTTVSADTQQTTDDLGNKKDANAVYVECDIKKKAGTGGNCEPRSVNVFQEKETYYVFLLFAKKNTKQTYQIYVGDNGTFKPASDFKAVKVTEVDVPFAYTDWKQGFDSNNPKNPVKPLQAELISSATGKPDPKGDVLQVTVDLSKVPATDAELDPKKATSETCKPDSFCKWSGATCTTSLKDDDPQVVTNPSLKTIANNVCGEWAVKDLDSPAGGRLGFSFTLPAGFKARDQYKRPPPEVPDQTKEPWKSLVFKPTDQKPDSASGGTCNYSPVPGTGDCKVPD
jgi:hypothetical protein